MENTVAARAVRAITARFLEKVSPEPNSGCWLWDGTHDANGYGRVYPYGFGEQRVQAHRLSYELFCEPVPEGLQINHKCDTPACVNPDHLYAGTVAQNSRDYIERQWRSTAEGGAPRLKIAGENNPAGAKITAEQALAIRDDERSNSKIAAIYGLSKTTVSDIKNRRKWAHL